MLQIKFSRDACMKSVSSCGFSRPGFSAIHGCFWSSAIFNAKNCVQVCWFWLQNTRSQLDAVHFLQQNVDSLHLFIESCQHETRIFFGKCRLVFLHQSFAKSASGEILRCNFPEVIILYSLLSLPKFLGHKIEKLVCFQICESFAAIRTAKTCSASCVPLNSLQPLVHQV